MKPWVSVRPEISAPSGRCEPLARSLDSVIHAESIRSAPPGRMALPLSLTLRYACPGLFSMAPYGSRAMGCSWDRRCGGPFGIAGPANGRFPALSPGFPPAGLALTKPLRIVYAILTAAGFCLNCIAFRSRLARRRPALRNGTREQESTPCAKSKLERFCSFRQHWPWLSYSGCSGIS